RLQALADFLSRKKVKLSDNAQPEIDTAEANRVYIHMLRAATSGRQSDAEWVANRKIADGLPADDESYYARMMRANTLSHRDWLAFAEKRRKMEWAWHEFFQTYDVLLCPAASSAAFPHDQEGERYQRTITVNNKKVPTTDQLFWAGYTGVVYLPSTVAPAGLTKFGLPVGVQIVGPYGGDRTTIAFAKLLEKEWLGFQPPPNYA
ncbi:MAG: amidase family protein, partial [Alphaproteobacteria bacterium]